MKVKKHVPKEPSRGSAESMKKMSAMMMGKGSAHRKPSPRKK